MAKKRGAKARKRRRLNDAPSKQIEQDNMRPMLVARCREMGWEPTVGNLARVQHPIFESEAGRLIVRAHPGDSQRARDRISELFQALTHIRRVRARYLRAKCAPKPDPQNAAISMVPNRFEVTEDLAQSPDPLPDEEEYARACAAHANLQRWLQAMGHAEKAEVIAVAVNSQKCKDAKAYIRGLEIIAERLTGRREAA